MGYSEETWYVGSGGHNYRYTHKVPPPKGGPRCMNIASAYPRTVIFQLILNSDVQNPDTMQSVLLFNSCSCKYKWAIE